MTNPFYDTFSNPHVILPVIHVCSDDQAVEQTQLAKSCGADGVFLIGHNSQYKAPNLLPLVQKVRHEVPDFWVGANFLDLSLSHLFNTSGDEDHQKALQGLGEKATPSQKAAAIQRIVNQKIDLQRVSGIWTDNANPQDGPRPPNRITWAAEINARIRSQRWPGIYFGGFAFKYQPQPDHLEKEARYVAGFVDVVTTSGDGTAQSASIGKIIQIREAIGPLKPLAIASGVTPENVEIYLPHANAFLVASGISLDWHNFSESKMKSLVDRVRAFES